MERCSMGQFLLSPTTKRRFMQPKFIQLAHYHTYQPFYNGKKVFFGQNNRQLHFAHTLSERYRVEIEIIFILIQRKVMHWNL